MGAIPHLDTRRSKTRLYSELATSISDIRDFQALRFRVFAEELGADVKGAELGYEEDEFDPCCQHLLVREGMTGRIVASTRLLLDHRADQAGGFYSSTEFDLGPLQHLPGRRLEIGRTCVDPGYRRGAAITVLWSGLAEFVKSHNVDVLFGCASIDMDDGGVHAQVIMHRGWEHAMTDSDCRVTPTNPLPPLPDIAADTLSAPLPPLLKAYFRLGARACGEPCYDPAFNCADVLVSCPVNNVSLRTPPRR